MMQKMASIFFMFMSFSFSGFAFVSSEKVYALPNPFVAKTNTAVEFVIPKDYKISRISVFNEFGKFVKIIAGHTNSNGKVSFKWSGNDDEGMVVSAGMYFVLINGTDLIKLVLYR